LSTSQRRQKIHLRRVPALVKEYITRGSPARSGKWQLTSQLEPELGDYPEFE